MQPAEHDTDTENFEDAVDATSVRSLTKRSASTSKPNLTADNDSVDDRSNYEKQDQDDVDSSTDDEKPDVKQKSPVSHRLSVASGLDDVNLGDDAPQLQQPTQQQQQDGSSSPVPPTSPQGTQNIANAKAPVEQEQAGRAISLSSITSALPAMPWSPSAESPAKSPGSVVAVAASGVSPIPPPQSQFQPPTRKLTSPFSWLSRNSSKDKDPGSIPSTSPRRNTASSVATITSNPEMMLSKLEEEKEGDLSGGSTRESLKDRFKMLRMREEAGVVVPIGEEDTLAPSTRDRSDSSMTTERYQGTEALSPGEQPPPSPVPDADASLAPGTVSGVKAGPSAMEESNVDWDLWQSVVYEGPAAVARTSAEELNRAIASGIPNAIRGVIWQVLAQSKNDELEVVYKELTTGTAQGKDRNSNSTQASLLSNGNLSVHSGEAANSSSSSISEQSGGLASGDKTIEAAPKSPILPAADRIRKVKEDAAALQKLEKTIRRDMGARTSFSKYAAAAGLQDGLFGVCKAYALFDEGVGYAQGMNFLIMPLLFNMPEQEAFCLLVRLMNNYHLRDLFIQDMPGLHKALYQFERLLEDFEPALYCHLHRKGISPHLYATQWFLTLFAYRFPLQLVLRIYDLIFSEGLSAILRFGIVLMQKNASTLLALSDMQQLTTFLKDKLFDAYIDKDPSQGSLLESGFFGSSSASIDKEVYRADQLVKDACEVKITPETLKLYSIEWEEKTKAEKDRETELLELRAANQSFQINMRKLEERVEVCDREQAALATELVHTKVENEELKDQNESLKGQVHELRVVIEKQPEELETAWQAERDSLMKRNEKVHEENQKLEKELADLEEQLVQTKMQYAEINSAHETLNRKWADMKRQFD
ncbi:rab-GTPase-TBC domain-containing protein [Sarocladium implicatum]|nr:rab-GTPase-TBC domain-containing protein [Sarocladium implicatum]